MTQVFARYAKDLLEQQTYPEVRRSPDSAVEPPYDVTAWSLGMQLGVDVQFVRTPLPESLRMTRVNGRPHMPGKVSGTGSYFTFDYTGADTAIAINRLLKAGARWRSIRRPRRLTAPKPMRPGTRARVAVRGASREMRRHALARARTVGGRGHRAAPARHVADDAHPGATDRPVLAVDRRQHRRRLDALGARAVRVRRHRAPQRGHP